MRSRSERDTHRVELLARYLEEARTQATGPGWLGRRRQQALAVLAERGLPGPRDERWRFLDHRRLLATHWPRWRPSGRPTGGGLWAGAPDPAAVLVGDAVTIRYPEVGGARLRRFAERWEHTELARRLTALATRYHDNPLAAINTALFGDGLWIEVPDGTVVEEPLVIAVHRPEAARGTALYPRVLVQLGRGARLQLIEHHDGVGPGWSVAVVEAEVAAEAQLEHVVVEAPGEETVLVRAHELVLAGPGADATVTTVAWGGHQVRNDLDVRLAAPEVTATLNGLTLATHTEEIDHHTRLEHLEPDGRSQELYKSVLDGRAHGIFNGRIYVAPGAQRTDAFQAAPNLLLGDEAVANANPELEIYADDVRCTHGATFGSLDEATRFYLRSRGIPASEAEALLVYAFAAEVAERITLPSLRHHVEGVLHRRLLGRGRS